MLRLVFFSQLIRKSGVSDPVGIDAYKGTYVAHGLALAGKL